uniref:Uncharacterized protein n=1 Tax=Fundidesulfovibrio putealis TaxID=270496 RepID=A0A7C4AIB5_9BACT
MSRALSRGHSTRSTNIDKEPAAVLLALPPRSNAFAITSISAGWCHALALACDGRV